MGVSIDIAGLRFGRLTPLCCTHRVRNRVQMWECVCDCGRLTNLPKTKVTSGQTKSCGCLRDEMRKTMNIKHGLIIGGVRHPLYQTWSMMKDRCSNPKSRKYKDYGERGIYVCERWINDFAAFVEDMGDKPSSDHSIDRIDNDGPYAPENCRWATSLQQNLNKGRAVKETSPSDRLNIAVKAASENREPAP